jgi:uncharacterized protein
MITRREVLTSSASAIGFSMLGCSRGQSGKKDYPVQAVRFTDVDVTDGFWAPRMETNRTVSIQHCFKKSESTGRSGSARLIEGAAYMLALRRDPPLEAYVDRQIEGAAARLESQLSEPANSIRTSGDFLEAAVAYFEATGKRRMLDAAIRAADVMDSVYGPGKKTYISGHEGQKMGLIRLARHTVNEKYWRLAKFFLDERGKDDYPRQGEAALDRTYAQDHKPAIQQTEAVGHCVRAMYLYIPMTDIAALTGQTEYSAAVDKIWEDMVYRKTYLTGAIGSIRFHEQFGAPYELPNLSAWNETCASYGNVLWNHRMFLLHRDAKYIDLMERVLYNAIATGVSLKGDRFFYQNPLKSFGNYERFDWINVPCCPPNVVRLTASIGGYIYAAERDAIYVNLFAGSKANVKLGDTSVNLRQETRYPWDGAVKINVDPAAPANFTLYVRIPGWTGNQVMPGDLYSFMENPGQPPVLKLNGEPVNAKIDKGFAIMNRRWQQGDVVELSIPMSVRRVQAHPQVREDEGRVALQRGPLVYCAEWPDNGGRALNIVIPDDARFKAEFRKDLLNGVTAVTGSVQAVRRAKDGVSLETAGQELTAIPYCVWANRGMGEMEVFLPRKGDRARVTPIPRDPVVRVSSSGGIKKGWTGYNDQNDDIAAVYDGVEPLNSADESNLYFRMRPPVGQPAWIVYEFNKPTQISSVDVYWADDKRFCRLPATWRVLVRDSGGGWKPVAARNPYTVEKDRFNSVTFEPVNTSAVRLEVEPKRISYKAGQIGPPEAMFIDKDIEWGEFGIIEWKVRSEG